MLGDGDDDGDDEGEAVRIVPDGGSGGGADGRPAGGGAEGSLGSLVVLAPGSVGAVDAGPGMPISVFFASSIAPCPDWMAAAMCDPEPGGGGGAAGFRSEFFFPRPSKISRSDPPLFSSDIRVS